MKKFLFTQISLIFFNYCFGQNVTLNGKIEDAKTGKSLPYATIEIFNLKTGTIADNNGKFSLEIVSNNLRYDTINFSYIGYKTVKMSINDFIKAKKIVVLNEKTVILNEIKIIPKKYLISIVGIKDKKHRSVQYTSVFGANKGNFLENKKQKIGRIKSVSYYLCDDGYPTTPFRVRIYELGKDKKPGKDLLNKNVVVSAQKSGWFKIDIFEYNVPFPKEGVFIMMEWINSGDEFYFEREVVVKGKDGQSKIVKRKYYGQSLGTISKKGSVIMWGTTLGNKWVSYDFNYKGKYVNAMINAEIAYEK